MSAAAKRRRPSDDDLGAASDGKRARGASGSDGAAPPARLFHSGPAGGHENAQHVPSDDSDGGNDRARGGAAGGNAGLKDRHGDDDDGSDEEVARFTGTVLGEEDEDENARSGGGASAAAAAPSRFDQDDDEGPMEAFNLKGEREDGHFDAYGNFVWKDKVEANDPWLQQLDEADTEAAIGEQDELRRKAKAAGAISPPMSPGQGGGGDEVDRRGVLAKLVPLLQPGETVLAALRRLGPTKPSGPAAAAAAAAARRKKKAGGAAAAAAAQPAAAAAARSTSAKRAFDLVTELADKLMRDGDVTVYQRTREQLGGLATAGSRRAAPAPADPGLSPNRDSMFTSASSASPVPRVKMPRKMTTSEHAWAVHRGPNRSGVELVEVITKAATAAAAGGGGGGGAPPSAMVSAYVPSKGWVEARLPKETITKYGNDCVVQWQYLGNDEAAGVHGPFLTSDLLGWRQQGFFTGDSTVDVRPVIVRAAAKDDNLTPSPTNNAADLAADFDDDDDDEPERVEAVVGLLGDGGVVAVPFPWVNSDTVDLERFL